MILRIKWRVLQQKKRVGIVETPQGQIRDRSIWCALYTCLVISTHYRGALRGGRYILPNTHYRGLWRHISHTLEGTKDSIPGDPTLPCFQPPHFDPPPIPSYSSRRVHSETPIYAPPHSSLWVMGHHSSISSSICTHLHSYALLWIHMCTSACICMSTTPS